MCEKQQEIKDYLEQFEYTNSKLSNLEKRNILSNYTSTDSVTYSAYRHYNDNIVEEFNTNLINAVKGLQAEEAIRILGYTIEHIKRQQNKLVL